MFALKIAAGLKRRKDLMAPSVVDLLNLEILNLFLFCACCDSKLLPASEGTGKMHLPKPTSQRASY